MNYFNYTFQITQEPLQHHRFYLVYVSVDRFLPRIKELYTIFWLPSAQSRPRLLKKIADLEKQKPFDKLWLEGLNERVFVEHRGLFSFLIIIIFK